MLPELLKLVDERVLQLVERREHGIGEVLTDMPEDLLGREEFGTVGWQIERMHARGPTDFSTAMTARAIEHDPGESFGCLTRVPKFFESRLVLGTGFLMSPAPCLPQADGVS